MCDSCPNPNPHHLVRTIFTRSGQTYIDQCELMPFQIQKALEDTVRCGTEAMGRGYEQFCSRCQKTHVVFNCCQNRSCPRCHWIQKNKWWRQTKKRLPYCSYSFVTVTPPPELYAIIFENQKFWYDLLMKIPASVIKEFGEDKKYLGALPAIIGVFQSWNNKLDFHPHCHFVVSNGGERDNEWIEPRNPYWIPTGQVSDRIKELMLKHVRKNRNLWKEHPEAFRFIEEGIEKGKWTVDCQPVGNARKQEKDENGVSRLVVDHEVNLEKLLKYASRDALAGHRIIAIDDDENVTIQYKEQSGGQERMVTEVLSDVEYIRRFMQHVPPKRFHRVRCYGLAHSSKKSELRKAKELFETKCQESGSVMDQWLEQCQQQIMNEEPDKIFGRRCSSCGSVTLKDTRTFFVNYKLRKDHFDYASRASPEIPPCR